MKMTKDKKLAIIAASLSAVIVIGCLGLGHIDNDHSASPANQYYQEKVMSDDTASGVNKLIQDKDANFINTVSYSKSANVASASLNQNGLNIVSNGITGNFMNAELDREEQVNGRLEAGNSFSPKVSQNVNALNNLTGELYYQQKAIQKRDHNPKFKITVTNSDAFNQVLAHKDEPWHVTRPTDKQWKRTKQNAHLDIDSSLFRHHLEFNRDKDLILVKAKKPIAHRIKRNHSNADRDLCNRVYQSARDSMIKLYHNSNNRSVAIKITNIRPDNDKG